MTVLGELVGAMAGKLFVVFKRGAAIIVGRVLATFGLALVSFQSVLPNLKQFLLGYVQGIPPKALEFMGAVGLDVAMTMILSALTVRLAWKVFIIPKGVADALPGATP